jgi:hypothetical protein
MRRANSVMVRVLPGPDVDRCRVVVGLEEAASDPGTPSLKERPPGKANVICEVEASVMAEGVWLRGTGSS